MTSEQHGDWKTVEDPDLAAWLSADSEEVRELIVEAQVPKRKVSFRTGPDGRSVPEAIDSNASRDRAAALGELDEFLSERLQLTTNVLKAAGAIVVRANSRQARQFAEHPLVKGIRPNRRLR